MTVFQLHCGFILPEVLTAQILNVYSGSTNDVSEKKSSVQNSECSMYNVYSFDRAKLVSPFFLDHDCFK